MFIQIRLVAVQINKLGAKIVVGQLLKGEFDDFTVSVRGSLDGRIVVND